MCNCFTLIECITEMRSSADGVLDSKVKDSVPSLKVTVQFLMRVPLAAIEYEQMEITDMSTITKTKWLRR